MRTGVRNMFGELGSVFGINPTARRKRLCGCLSLLLAMLLGFASGSISAAQSTSEGHGKLQIFFVDVEGGQSTLFVTPDGHSLLIDTGWGSEEHTSELQARQYLVCRL